VAGGSPTSSDVESPHTATAEDARNNDTFGDLAQPITPRFGGAAGGSGLATAPPAPAPLTGLQLAFSAM
jgi:hypothetical protein